MLEQSVIIPTYNRLPMLLRVLEALGHQQSAPSFEVLVIDDGSTDSTNQTLTSRAEAGTDPFPLHFESQRNSGPGAARNRGVTLARGRRVVFIGDDTVPEPAFLREHDRFADNPGSNEMTACLGYTSWPRDTRVTSFMHHINDYGLQFGYKLIRDGEIVPFNFFYTSNISIDRQLMLRFPFDTTFPSAAWEDIELAYRLDKQGLKIRYNALALTRHHHPMTVASFSRRQYTVGRSGAIFYEKHPELGHFLGVHELNERPLADDRRLRRMTRSAQLGERFSLFARPSIYEQLMREHYLRGLRDGLEERKRGE